MKMENAYPIFVKLQGRKCLVIGGGQVGFRKAETLLQYGAQVDVIACEITEEMRALADHGRINLSVRAYEDGDEEGHSIVFAATGDSSVNRRIAENCHAKGIWLNAVDDPEHCDFYVPAQLRRGDVTVAVSTFGKSPVLAAQIKEKIAEVITGEYGVLADLLGEIREEVNGSGKSTEEKKAFYQDLMAKDPLTMIRSKETQQVREMFKSCLSCWLE